MNTEKEVLKNIKSDLSNRSSLNPIKEEDSNKDSNSNSNLSNKTTIHQKLSLQKSTLSAQNSLGLDLSKCSIERTDTLKKPLQHASSSPGHDTREELGGIYKKGSINYDAIYGNFGMAPSNKKYDKLTGKTTFINLGKMDPSRHHTLAHKTSSATALSDNPKTHSPHQNTTNYTSNFKSNTHNNSSPNHLLHNNLSQTLSSSSHTFGTSSTTQINISHNVTSFTNHSTHNLISGQKSQSHWELSRNVNIVPTYHYSDMSLNKSKKDDKKVVKFLIPAKAAGAIIGKGGLNIKHLREFYKAHITIGKGRLEIKDTRFFEVEDNKIDVFSETIEPISFFIPDAPAPERVIKIQMPEIKSAVEVSKKIIDLLKEDIQKIRKARYHKNHKHHSNDEDLTEMRLLVHESQAGAIIGPKGSHVKRVNEKTGAKINVHSEICPRSTEKIVQITGKIDSIGEAIGEILKLFEDFPPKGNVFQYDPNHFDPSYDYGGYGYHIINNQNGNNDKNGDRRNSSVSVTNNSQLRAGNLNGKQKQQQQPQQPQIITPIIQNFPTPHGNQQIGFIPPPVVPGNPIPFGFGPVAPIPIQPPIPPIPNTSADSNAFSMPNMMPNSMSSLNSEKCTTSQDKCESQQKSNEITNNHNNTKISSTYTSKSSRNSTQTHSKSHEHDSKLDGHSTSNECHGHFNGILTTIHHNPSKHHHNNHNSHHQSNQQNQHLPGRRHSEFNSNITMNINNHGSTAGHLQNNENEHLPNSTEAEHPQLVHPANHNLTHPTPFPNMFNPAHAPQFIPMPIPTSNSENLNSNPASGSLPNVNAMPMPAFPYPPPFFPAQPAYFMYNGQLIPGPGNPAGADPQQLQNAMMAAAANFNQMNLNDSDNDNNNNNSNNNTGVYLNERNVLT